MSRKRLFIVGAIAIILVNGSIFGTLYLIDWINGPSPAELKALREAKEAEALAAVYEKLSPLPEFKSKATNLRSIGEAIGICEDKLHQSVTENKSWEVNMIDSRFINSTEIYKIFLEYKTVSKLGQESKHFKVTCEVSGETRVIDLWKANPA